MFKSLFTTHLALISAFTYILLLFGCGGEEIITNPISESTNSQQLEPQPPSYYPMTIGSRWVYRDADGSEWSRQITETERFGANLYHSFYYDPPIQDRQLDAFGPHVYAAYLDRLDRRIDSKDIDNAVWETIVKSGGESPNWAFGMSCKKQAGRKPVCISTKDKLNPGILTYLFNTNTSVVWHSKLTLLRFPLVPGETYKALDLRLRGRLGGPFHIHDFEVEGMILGNIGGARELVETPAGAFEDCLKIQYEAEQTSLKTLQFVNDGVPNMINRGAELEAIESTLRDELTDLLTYLMPKLGLQTVWLAPGVGPVKIETPNGIAELIDYEIKTVASDQ